MSFIFGGETGQTQDSITDARRRMAIAQLQQGMQSSPIQSPWQGVARLSEALMGGLQVRRQAQQEQDANSQVMSAISGQPYTPPAQSPGFLSSLFGNNNVPASGAQGQMAAANPSPAVGHASDMAGLDSNQIYSGFMDTVKQGTPQNPGVTNPYALAAIASTGKAESSFDPKLAGSSWNDGANNAGGIMSWNGPRLANLQKFAGGTNGTPQQQGQFFLQENPALIAALNKAGSVEEAQHLMNNAWAFKGYNQPGNPNAANRLATAQAFLPKFAGQGGAAPNQVASLNPSAGMGAPQQPYRDPMVTTAYQEAAPAPSSGSPAVQAIQQQAPLPGPGVQLPPPQLTPDAIRASVSQSPQQPMQDIGPLAPGPRVAPLSDQNFNDRFGAGGSPATDPTQTASVGPMQPPQAVPPLDAPVNIPNQPISNPMPLDRSGVGMGGAAPGPGAFPTAPGDGPARLAAALQGAQQGPQGAPPQQQLAQAMQGQGGAQGSISPLAGNPRAQALMQAMMNPYASPQARQMAGSMLQMQMQPQFDFVTRADGSIVAVNKFNPSQSQQVQAPLKTKQVIEGPVDPATGLATKMLYDPVSGTVDGIIGPHGELLPPGQQAQQQGAAPGAIPQPPPGVDPKKYREEAGNISAHDLLPTAHDEMEFANSVTSRKNYQEYSAAAPTWNSFTQHIQDNTAGSDKAIVDDFAKILNPGRAVTTGGFQLNMDAQGIPELIQGQIMKALNGDGELGPDARAAMARAAQIKMTEYKRAWQTDADQSAKIAKAHHLDPDRVVPQIPDLADIDFGKINSLKTTASGTGPYPGPSAASPAGAQQGGMPTATGPNGAKIQWNGSAWVPLGGGN